MDLLQFSLLALLFVLTIAHLLSLKVCSLTLDHKTAPLFIAFWTLLGAALVYPLYADLWEAGLAKFLANPWLPVFALLKGAALCYLFVVSQRLMQVSLSSRHYVTPLALGLITLGNGLFGEALTGAQIFSSLGLCALACAFFLKGHLAELDAKSRVAYAQLVGLSAVISIFDHVLTKDANWYVLLVFSYGVVFAVALCWNFGRLDNIKTAAFSRAAIIAGVFYAATELVKAYQQVAINPVTVVVTVQAMTKPVILVASAWLWKERTVREQLAWGLAALVITLPMFLWDDIMALVNS